MLLFWMLLGTAALPPSQEPVSPVKRDHDGLLCHVVRSEYQAEPTLIRVLLPDRVEAGERLPTVYVLPVEARQEHAYGDGLTEIRKLRLHDRFRAVFVAPTFSHLPWYADHPTDLGIRQETYFLKVVLPIIEQHYPVRNDPGGRLLLGFSKSGWGAYSLLLRHPEVFGKAVAWDAPLMMEQPGKYGSAAVFGTPANFVGYRISRLLSERAAALGPGERLILVGYGNFREDHQRTHDLMQRLGIPHLYRDGPQRPHDWHAGWVLEAVNLLLGDR